MSAHSAAVDAVKKAVWGATNFKAWDNDSVTRQSFFYIVKVYYDSPEKNGIMQNRMSTVELNQVSDSMRAGKRSITWGVVSIK